MAELRWVLLALGILVVAGVYLWGWRSRRRAEVMRREARSRRSEPRLSSSDDAASADVLFTRPGEAGTPGALPESAAEPLPARDEHDVPSESEAWERPAEPTERGQSAARQRSLGPERVVALRFVPRDPQLDAVKTVEALREAGLEHGRYGIFHYHDQAYPKEPRFSVASLTEPGSFDLDRLEENPLAGMSFFMVLPGIGDPVDRFDAMVETARSLAHELDAELFDDAGSSWSIQRERYIREELISYRLQSAPF